MPSNVKNLKVRVNKPWYGILLCFGGKDINYNVLIYKISQKIFALSTIILINHRL